MGIATATPPAKPATLPPVNNREMEIAIEKLHALLDVALPQYLDNTTKAKIKSFTEAQTAIILQDGKITKQELLNVAENIKKEFKVEIEGIIKQIANGLGADDKLSKGIMALTDEDVIAGLKEIQNAFRKHIKGEKEVVVDYKKLLYGVIGLFMAAFWLAWFIFDVLK